MRLKKTFYLGLAIVLFLAISMIIHALWEMWLIGNLLEAGLIPQGGRCFLPIQIQAGLFSAAIVLGYLVGQRWWQIVYVEKRHWRQGRSVAR